MRANDILRALDLLASRGDVDPMSIRGAAKGVAGVWMLLAAAADSRIGGIWLDRTPFAFSAAMDGPLNANLFEGFIRGFLRHWDLPDVAKAVRPRRVMWVDPADWMGLTVFPGDGYRHRKSGETDAELLADLFRK